MQLDWKDIDQNEYQVTYNMTDGEIKRSIVMNDGAPVQSLIAQDISSEPSSTNLTYIDGLLTLNVTSTYGTVDVSRNYQIKRRLDF